MLGHAAGACRTSRFSDGETFFEIDENVRGRDAFVIQPTCSPVNDNLMELLIMCDALRRASAGVHHGRDPVLRLRAPGSQGRSAHAHHVEARRGSARRRRRERASLSSTCTPGRSRGSSTSPSITCTRCPSSSRTISKRRFDQIRGLRLAGRGRRRANARVLEAARRVARHHRQAARARERERGDAPHRRRQGPRLHHRRRHDRHRGHALQRRAGRHARGRAARGRRRDARRAERAPRCSASPSRRSKRSW